MVCALLGRDVNETPHTQCTQVAPVPTQPSPITVVGCQSGLSDVLRLDCWSRGKDAAIASLRNRTSATFAYTWAATPTIVGLNASSALPGEAVMVQGLQLAEVVAVELRQVRYFRCFTGTLMHSIVE